MSTRTKGLAFEKLTLNAHKEIDWLTVVVAVLVTILILEVVLSVVILNN